MSETIAKKICKSFKCSERPRKHFTKVESDNGSRLTYRNPDSKVKAEMKAVWEA